MTTIDPLLDKVARAEADGALSAPSAAAIRRWLAEPPFAAYRDRLAQDVAAGNWKVLDEAYYAVLEFGTGGRRGKMYPVGTNVLNARTIAESARGLADYVVARKGPDAPKSCVIARDTRHNSAKFAEICARVLAAAGFKVYLFPEFRSTPLLSFATRHLKCDAGIMITASHNPPEYNGFKCYAATGGQVVPPDDAGIIARVKTASDREIPLVAYHDALADGQIALVGKEVDEAYIANVLEQSVSHARDLSIVYTPMHGVGETSVAAALNSAGFAKVEVLAAERQPDGDFANIPDHVANPEIPKTLDASIRRARDIGADLVIGSDPDADRIGVGVPLTRDPSGAWTTLDGNQIGVLLSAFVLKQLKANGRLRPDHYLVTTLVSTQMTEAVAAREGSRVVGDLLVGFKWIGQRIDEEGPAGFVFGFEESHGYLRGAYARDKDSAVAALLFAELAATVKDREQTVLEYLDDLYIDVGHHGERTVNKTMEGREGAAQIKKLMAAFRDHPPEIVAGMAVREVRDYKEHLVRYPDGRTEPLPQPDGDLLIFHLDKPGVRFAARPSGTEPKIKFYLYARTPVDGPDALPAAKVETRRVLDAIAADIEAFVAGAMSS